jgi:type I pantothenate kinase
MTAARAWPLSDFFDFSIYVDAKTSYIEEWYVDRFRKLRTTAFAQPESYFHRYATLSDDEAEVDGTRHLEAHQRTKP